jgi:hypothetical protein
MASSVYARCPGCDAEVEDPLTGDTFPCPRCGQTMRSLGKQFASSDSPQLRRMVAASPPPRPPTISAEKPPERAPASRAPVAPRRYDTAEDLRFVKELFKRLAHGFVYIGIFSLIAFVVIDLAILVWGYFPVHDAALQGKATSTLFLMGLHPVGEATWTGVGALALGVVLLVVAAVLTLVHRSGRVPGLGGPGTQVVAVLTGCTGMCVLVWGTYLAASGHLTEGLTTSNWIPTPIGLLRLRFHLVAHWHGVLVGAILCSFAVMAVKDWPEIVPRFRRSLAKLELPTIRTDNTWIAVFRFYLAILGLYVLYYLVLDIFTVDPTIPAFHEQPLWDQLHIFADASVWEEIVSRVLMLGLPLWIYHMLAGRVGTPAWRYAIGGGFRIENAAFVLIFAQAFIFALAHVAGWDLWKVIPTTVSGMAFGYLFLKRGLWAAIALHFTFDYLGMTPRVFASWGVDIDLAFYLFELLWIAAGLVLLVHYIVIVVKEGPGVVMRALFKPQGDRPGEG